MTDQSKSETASDYRMRVLPGVGAIGRSAWEALLQTDGREPTPFLRHAFLDALESTGCVGSRTGWLPEFVTLWAGEQLVAAAPVYRKLHSYGEYVFDWAWADAYERNGLPYYPKLVCAVPFTPVPGPRLLACDAHARRALADALLAHAGSAGRKPDRGARVVHPSAAATAALSSVHVLFPDDWDMAALESGGWLVRDGVQFHWRNPGWADFDAYLAALSQPKRKKVRAERRHVRDAGITCRILEHDTVTDEALRYFYTCYARTYRAHRSTPYLNSKFFETWARNAPADIVLSLAERAGQAVGCALLARSGDRMYGRYWGSTDPVPCLHFETAYYAPIEWALGAGILTFEGGAQGEHKLARGFTPVRTRSAHWLAHPAFAQAVGRFLERETGGIDEYLDELNERLPFRSRSVDYDGSAP